MRNLAAFVLALALAACSAAPPPSCGAPGLARSCPCVGGAQGAQECSPGGAWTACACAAQVDAGSDALAAVDARADAPNAADARRDADPRCSSQPSAISWCEEADAGVCVDLQRDPRNCGRCGRGCDNIRTECFGGECFVPVTDAGRD